MLARRQTSCDHDGAPTYQVHGHTPKKWCMVACLSSVSNISPLPPVSPCISPRSFRSLLSSAQIAEKYYGKDKLYVFNGLHDDPDGPTFEERDQARPVISNLFDTFVAVS